MAPFLCSPVVAALRPCGAERPGRGGCFSTEKFSRPAAPSQPLRRQLLLKEGPTLAPAALRPSGHPAAGIPLEGTSLRHGNSCQGAGKKSGIFLEGFGKNCPADRRQGEKRLDKPPLNPL